MGKYCTRRNTNVSVKKHLEIFNEGKKLNFYVLQIFPGGTAIQKNQCPNEKNPLKNRMFERNVQNLHS